MHRIYLDANATTPVAQEAVDAMLPFLTDHFGNPSSAHASGQRTRSAVEHARAAVAALLQAQPKEIVFTSGATESNNLALSGILQPYLDRNEPAHLITSQTEHHAVLNAAESLERRGIAVTFLPPDSSGLVDPAAFQAALRPNTRLVSIMLANNETGVIQPIGKLARIAKAFAAGIVFHTDAVQAAGKLPIDLAGEFKNIDLLSISGHKIYAPQGTGALFVRKGIQLAPLFHGGPHERQRRAGTENVPGIAALGKAAELAQTYLHSVISTEALRPNTVISTESLSSNFKPELSVSTGGRALCGRSGETCIFLRPRTPRHRSRRLRNAHPRRTPPHPHQRLRRPPRPQHHQHPLPRHRRRIPPHRA